MAEQEEEGVWNVLSQLAQQEPQEEEDEIPVDVMAEEGTGPAPGVKVPFEQQKNVKLLRQAHDGVMEGSLTVDQYRGLIEQVYQVSQMAVEICKSPEAKSRTANLPKDQLEVIAQLTSQSEKLHAGVEQMYSYCRQQDKEAVAKGYATAIAAMREIARIQDVAAQKAEDEAERKRENAPKDEGRGVH